MKNKNFFESPFQELVSKKGIKTKKSDAATEIKRHISKARKNKQEEPLEFSCEFALFLSAMDAVEPEHLQGIDAKGMAAMPSSLEAKESLAFVAQRDGCNPSFFVSNDKDENRVYRKRGQLASNDSSLKNITGSLVTARKAPLSIDEHSETNKAEILSENPSQEAFMLAMREVHPLHVNGRDVPAPVPLAEPHQTLEASELQNFLNGKLEFALSFTDEYCEGHVVGLDPLIMTRLRQGSFSPEGHVDLHGLNVQQAFETLRGFFKSAWFKGLRCIIVIPGRGKNSPDGIPILREKIQIWFTQEPFKRVILAFCTAQSHDGGAGSIYVLLRKFKKKGNIYWDRMPADVDLF